MKRRVLSVVLALSLWMSMIPAGTWAAEPDSTELCPHHPEHTVDCGYILGNEGSPCAHEHTEECFALTEACTHEHDDDCGYSEAVDGAPCGYVCEICNGMAGDTDVTDETDESIEPAADEWQVMPFCLWEGSGTEEDPYQISTREELELIADAVNGGDELLGVYFVQTQDIYLGGEDDPWPVIGHVVGNTPHPFNGVYNGGDHNIYGLFVGTTDEDGEPVGTLNEDAGLFGHVGEKGIIRRVHVVDCKVYSKALYVGGIAGRNEGLVEYCSSDATDPDASSSVVSGSWQYAGGIVGYNHGGKISYCYSNCDVYGAQKVGGITGGQNGGTVVNCYFRGYVYADDITRAYAGGIAGENDGESTIDNCYSDSIVEGRNDNAYCGAIAGSNDTGSTVGNCFWEDSEETDLPGIGSGMGDQEKVEKRTSEEFASGQVAWDLSKGEDGEGWGQTLDRGEDGEPDRHPHFVGQPDKSEDTSAVYRVRLMTKENTKTIYVDPNVDLDLTQDEYKLPENAKWYLVDENGDDILGDDGLPLVFDGNVTTHDVDAVARERILFGGETDTIVVIGTYSPTEQTLTLDLDMYMGYENDATSTEDRFEYTIIDSSIPNAELGIDGNSLTIPIPAGTAANEDGYTITVNAHEKEPYIAPLSIDSFGTVDVELTVNVIIGKATPIITTLPEASAIDYGQTLADSILTGGEARHPTAGTTVAGTFEWTTDTIAPAVPDSERTAYAVTFTPDDTTNYNTVITSVVLTVNKVDLDEVIPPTAIIGLVYNGSAQALINAGSATYGTMQYSLEKDGEYAPTIPARANAGDYTVWYKVVGDINHNDTEPQPIAVTISPAALTIPEQTVAYNGGTAFTVTLDGVPGETVTVTLTTFGKDVGDYEYDSEIGNGKYTVELSNTNYTVDTAKTLTIAPLPVVLSWSEPLTFTYDGQPHEVTATVSNAIEGDNFELTYKGNTATDEGDYTAEVTALGNENYTLDDAQNTAQPWNIIQESENVTLLDVDPVTYGDELTLTVEIAPKSDIGLMSLAPNKIAFYTNGNLLDIVDVTYNNAAEDRATVTLTVRATSKNNFSAGANAVTAEYSGNSNVQGGVAAITVIVNAKPITVDITGDTTKIYDGSNIAVGLETELIGVEECDKTQVTAAAESYIYNSANVTEADTITPHNITLSGAQSGNYVITDNVTISGKIEPKVVRLEWSGYAGLVYTGKAVNVTATATELVPGDECGVEVENGRQINAGTYIATAIGLTNSNYALPDYATSLEYTIAKAYPIYNLPVLIATYGDTLADVELPKGFTWNDDTQNVGNVGIKNFPATYTPNDTDNYYTVIVTLTVTVVKANAVVIKAPVANTLTYNGEAQELITAGEAIGGELQYSLSQFSGYDTKLPKGTNAGVYTVWYMAVGDDNHNSTEPQSVTVIINKADPIIDPLPAAKENLKYCGEAQELITAGKAIGGELLYSIDGENYAPTIPARANVDSYTVWYMVVGDENHNDTEPQPITVTINQAVLTIPEQTVTYNGGNTFTFTLDGVLDETVAVTLTTDSKNVGDYEYAAETDSGKYTVELSNTNYTIGEAKALTIAPLSVVLAWNGPLTFSYDGETEYEVTAEVINKVGEDEITLTYINNTGINAGSYVAEVISLSNTNYTLDGAQNVTQPWRINEETEIVTLTAKELITYGDELTLTVDIAPESDANGIRLMAAERDQVVFYVNGNLIGSADVTYTDSPSDETGTASITVTAASAKYFSVGANAVRAEYGGGRNVKGGVAAVTVTVNPKPITVTISGDTAKTYDGNNIAAGLELKLNGIEPCDSDNVTAAADSYTYNSANVTEATTITAQNVTLNGTQSGNYVINDAVATVGTINAKVVRLEWSGYAGLVYTGEAVNVTATATELIPGDVCEVTVINGHMTNAGTYTAEAMNLTNSNYALPDYGTTREYTIDPVALTIPEQVVTYNGGNTFMLTLDGVNGETVAVTLTTASKNAGDYKYATETDSGKYTAELSSANYTVVAAETLTILPKAAVLSWSEPLTFIYNGRTHEVNATVTNAEQGDTFSLSYKNNTAVNAGSYIAEIIDLGNDNYTLDGAQNVTQKWYITRENENVTLVEVDPVVYGDELVLTVNITPDTSSIRLMAIDADIVEFYANGTLLGSAPVQYHNASEDQGTATLRVKATSENNFSAGANAVTAIYSGTANVNSGETAITVTVYAKPITATINGDATKIYDGNDIATGLEIEPIGVEECDKSQVTITATYTFDSADAGSIKVITAQNITLDGEQSGNYVLDTTPVTTTGTIHPKVVNLEWSGYTGLVYTGEAVNVTATVTDLIPGDECAVMVENGQQINAGTYTAEAIGLTNSNYALPATGTTQEYTIAKADPTLIPPEAKENLKYTSEPQELVTAGSASGGELRYSLSEDGEYTTVIPTGTDAGSYTVWYKVVGDENHNDTVPQFVIVTIASDSSIDPDDPTNPDDPSGPDKPTNPNNPSTPSIPSYPNVPNVPNESDDNDIVVEIPTEGKYIAED